MGQAVVIKNTVTLGDMLLIDTDRSFTGQDGHVVIPDSLGRGVPARLGQKVFAADESVDYAHVLQNQVSLRRRGGWDEASIARVTGAVEDFLLFY
jgi:hypothetical protein